MPRGKTAMVTKNVGEGMAAKERRGAETAFVASPDGKWRRILASGEERECLAMVHDESKQAIEDLIAKGATLYPTSLLGPYGIRDLTNKVLCFLGRM